MQHPNLDHSILDHQNHTDHDSTLIAGHAAGDLPDSERTRAQALLDTCASCAELHRDLVAIAAATRALPNLAAAPRDFRLAPEQAERLRRGSWLRAALRPFASSRSATRPLAAAFTSLGIAGVFVVTVMPGLFGGAASAPALERQGTAAGGPAGATAPVMAPGESAPGFDQDGSSAPLFGAQASAGPDAGDPSDTKVDPVPTDRNEAAIAGQGGSPGTNEEAEVTGRLTGEAPMNPLLIGSVVLLAVGVLLFGLRLAARRIR